jgi:hypothetical protein
MGGREPLFALHDILQISHLNELVDKHLQREKANEPNPRVTQSERISVAQGFWASYTFLGKLRQTGYEETDERNLLLKWLTVNT